jgi:hypothetical protein
MLNEKSVHSTFCTRIPIGNRFSKKIPVFADRLHDATVLLKHPEDYDRSLEAFSRPLLQVVDYQLDEMGRMTVEDESAPWYSYMDMTFQAEALSEFIRKTIEEELVQELNFLASYDATY